MTWTVGELKGKYYGTKVQFDGDTVFTIWYPDHFAEPFASEREIAKGWTPDDGHDHIEDQQSYNTAKLIVDYLNSIDHKVEF